MEPVLSGAAGACANVTAGVAAGTITGIGDCAASMPESVKVARTDKAKVRILSASSAGVDSRYPKVLRDRGELRINLRLVLRDRDLLVLHLFGDREDLLFLLLACARGFGRRGDHEQGQGEKGGESWKTV